MAVKQFTCNRLNIGCGDYDLPLEDGWFNIDNAVGSAANMLTTVPPIPWPNQSIDEVYAGHFLEHLDYDKGQEFLHECYRVLKSGGKLGIVVPDTKEIVRRYLGEMGDYGQTADGRVFRVNDLDDVCAYWLFSTIQPSRHRWAYDLETLERALRQVGFSVTGEIDRHKDPRLGTGQWYQCGLDAVKP